MPTTNISLPDRIHAFAERRVAEGEFESLGDYVRDLIRRDQREQEARRTMADLVAPALADVDAERTVSLDDAFAEAEAAVVTASAVAVRP